MFHKLFIETNPKGIWSLYLPLMLLNLAITLALQYFGFWVPFEHLDSTTYVIVIIVFTALTYIFVKELAIDKSKRLWMLPILVLLAFDLILVVTEGKMEYSPVIMATITDSPGIKTKLYLQAIGWWDFILGEAIEFFLLVRIFLNIQPVSQRPVK